MQRTAKEKLIEQSKKLPKFEQHFLTPQTFRSSQINPQIIQEEIGDKTLALLRRCLA